MLMNLNARRVLMDDKFRPKFATLKGLSKDILLFKSK